MRPLRLRARNLRTYPDLDLEFGDGLIGILGELRDAPEGASSNGSGKSTILEALDIALFGRRSLAGYLTRGGDVDELMVELTFSARVGTYRARRTYSAKGRGKTSVDFERRDDATEEWIPLTQATAKETDDLICAVTGLSRDTFRDSSYMRQGDGGYADPDRSPSQRLQLLMESVLGRDPVWPKLAEVAKQRRKQAEAQLERVRGERESLRDLADQAQPAQVAARHAHDTVTKAGENLAHAEQRHQAVAHRYQHAREAAHARQTLEAELREATSTVTALQERQQKAEQAGSDLATARDEIAALASPEQFGVLEQRERDVAAQLETFTAARDAHERAKAALDEAIRRREDVRRQADAAAAAATRLRDRAFVIANAAEGTEHCELCKQRLGAEAAQEAKATLERQAREHRDRRAELLEQEGAIVLPFVGDAPVAPDTDGQTAHEALAGVRSQLEQARADQARRAALDERIRQLAHAAADTPADTAVTDALAARTVKQKLLDELEPVNVEIIEQEGKAASVAVETAQVARENAVAAAARADERLAQTKTAEATLAELATTTAALQAQVDRDLLLERAAGRDGIPALIIENTAIPAIEAEASRILHALGTGFQVELRTQAENKSGTLRDTLDVVVIDQDGNEADYADGCSGGEQTRIGLALRIALARLLAHRRGAESRLLALDEPSYLDAAGMAALLEVLRGLDAEFDLILLVSHVAELRDALEDVIVVVKENGVSTLAGAPVREEVAA